MRERKFSIVVLFLLTVIVVLVLLFSFQTKKATAPEALEGKNLYQSPAAKKQTAVSDTWKVFSAQGVTIKKPDYIEFVAGKSLRNALSAFDFRFTPNPSVDFSTFSATVQIVPAENFVLDLSNKFLAYNPADGSWYLNTNLADKPNSINSSYKNIYLSKNLYSPKVFVKTSGGLNVYGPFVVGDSDRGKSHYLVPLQSKKILILFEITYNQDAIDSSTTPIKALKAQFDKDFPEILKTITL